MTKKLLIVDDDEFMRTMTQTVLELDGYCVDSAVDGLDAWEKITADPSRFDLMLLDKAMPRLDGIGLLKRIKSDSRFIDLPVIMITGAGQKQDVVEGLAEGAYYYLTKPSAEEVLKRVIQNTLVESHNNRELREKLRHQNSNLRIMRRAEFSFSTLQEAKELALWLANASTVAERTVNGYSELLINAVEHGNLEIDYAEKSQLLRDGRWKDEVESRLQRTPFSDRWVSVLMEKTRSSCSVTITDQGSGFDWRNYMSLSPERAFDLHGRGIAIAKAKSFDSLEYHGNGNVVVAIVQPSQHD